MAIHFEPSALEAFRNRALAPAEMLRMDRHLRTCASCVGRLQADPMPAERLIRRVVAEGAHPDYLQLEACVDGRADAPLTERVRRHAAWCRRCADELDDLQAGAAMLRQRIERRSPSAAPASARWWRIGGWMPQWAGAALVAVIGLGVVMQERWGSDAVDGPHQSAIAAAPHAGDASGYDSTALSHLDRVSPAAQHAWQQGNYAGLAEALRKTADAGQPDAAEALGLLYAQGLGVARDLDAAARYWRIAVQSGSASAARNLALIGRG